MYEYSATVVKVYDGDTITVDIDLGFGIVLRKQKIRLYGVNTPEVRGEEKELGKKVRDLLREKILGETIIVKTIKDKKRESTPFLFLVVNKNLYKNKIIKKLIK